MKRIVKKGIMVFTITILAVVLIIVYSRYGWKLFGFSVCDSPNGMYADNITVENDEVNLRLNEVSSISAYAGYTNGSKIENIYFKDNKNEWLIWNEQDGRVKASDIRK